MNGKKALRLLEQLYCRIEDDEVFALGAQMTYYWILSFFPFLIFLLTLISHSPITLEDVLDLFSDYFPEMTHAIISEILKQVLRERNDALLSLGMLAALWAASRSITALIRGFNKAYHEEETRAWWKLKLLSVLFTFALSLVIMLTLVLLVFGHLLGERLFLLWEMPGYYETVWSWVKNLIAIGSMMVVFMFMYRYLPSRRLSFRSVLPGSVAASVGWIVVSIVFSFYVNNFNNYTRTYGSIGGIIVLLIWLYVSSVIILVGGEINATLTFAREGKLKPDCKSFSKRLFYWRK